MRQRPTGLMVKARAMQGGLEGSKLISVQGKFFYAWRVWYTRARGGRVRCARVPHARCLLHSTIFFRISFLFCSIQAHFWMRFFVFFNSLKKGKLQYSQGTFNRIKNLKISWTILKDIRVQSWKKKFNLLSFFFEKFQIQISLSL